MMPRSKAPSLITAQVYIQGPQTIREIPGVRITNKELATWDANFIPVRQVHGYSKEECWKKAKDSYGAPVLEFGVAA